MASSSQNVSIQVKVTHKFMEILIFRSANQSKLEINLIYICMQICTPLDMYQMLKCHTATLAFILASPRNKTTLMFVIYNLVSLPFATVGIHMPSKYQSPWRGRIIINIMCLHLYVLINMHVFCGSRNANIDHLKYLLSS